MNLNFQLLIMCVKKIFSDSVDFQSNSHSSWSTKIEYSVGARLGPIVVVHGERRKCKTAAVYLTFGAWET